MVVRVNPQQARQLIESGSVQVVDVRDPAEWGRGHIAGASFVELATVRSDPQKSVPRDGVLFVCAGGVRSETAARHAIAAGATRVYSLVGGTSSWLKAGLPLVNELSVAV